MVLPDATDPTQRGRRLIRSTPPARGAGIHTGLSGSVVVAPAPEGQGLVLRAGAPSVASLPISLAHAVPGPRRTLLRWGEAEAGTIEHLLAACVGLGIWDAQVILDGPEAPALDGSAAGYAEALWEASCPSTVAAPLWRVARPFAWGEAEASCRFEPASGCRVTCEIAFAEPSIGRQRAEHDLSGEGAALRFRRELAPARTFGLASEADALRRQGLACGASLENAVVFGANGPLNPDGLRFSDEPVRHKLVDLLGDLALLGGPLVGHVVAFRASHRLVQESLRRALQEGAVVRVAGGTPG